MKLFYACILFYLAIFYCSQTSINDTLRIELRQKHLFGSGVEMFPTDTFPLDVIPLTFHWLGLQGLNKPLYEFRTMLPSVQWSWNRNIAIHQDELFPFFLKSERPYVYMKGITGSRQWQDFKGIFSFPAFRGKGQNTIYLNRYGGLGFYNNQQTFINDLMLSSFFENESYNYEFYLLHRRQKFRENGGLLSDTLSLQQENTAKEFLPVKFYNANVRNAFWNANLDVYKVIRNSSSDTIASNKWLTGIQFSLNKETYQYVHDNPRLAGFYSLYYLDTLKTNDSIVHVEFSLGPALKVNNKNWTHQLFYNYAFGKIHQFSDSLYQNGYIGFHSRYEYKQWNATIFGRYNLHGFWQGNFASGTNVNYVFKFLNLEHDLDVSVSVEKRFPDWIFIRYYGNHFQWHTNPEIQRVYQSGFKLKSSFYELGACLSSTRNLYVWDEKAFPLLIKGPVINYRTFAGVKMTLGIWKNEIRFIFQVASHKHVVRMPDYLADVRSLFDFRMFSKNLWMQTGMDVRYIPSFIPYAYMPNTQVFYLRELSPVSEYIWLSPFISAKVNPARFYLKAENLLYLFMNKTVGWVNHYKQPGFWLHAGVSWEFRD